MFEQRTFSVGPLPENSDPHFYFKKALSKEDFVSIYPELVPEGCGAGGAPKILTTPFVGVVGFGAWAGRLLVGPRRRELNSSNSRLLKSRPRATNLLGNTHFKCPGTTCRLHVCSHGAHQHGMALFPRAFVTLSP